ncbi:hypothetical protein BS50DRAFT_32872 [Corynespora cassiicola Philippines]|uniref:Uncharacterized protein n=1 Tax=Corynespora cassiicola Philippines TaxID=1448308 RepID=A0A2T2PC43_CORCC|nr:hypothetical protein BS50DRAFT_32872 [Corynespora cassiicola Philippines]
MKEEEFSHRMSPLDEARPSCCLGRRSSENDSGCIVSQWEMLPRHVVTVEPPWRRLVRWTSRAVSMHRRLHPICRSWFRLASGQLAYGFSLLNVPNQEGYPLACLRCEEVREIRGHAAVTLPWASEDCKWGNPWPTARTLSVVARPSAYALHLR